MLNYYGEIDNKSHSTSLLMEFDDNDGIVASVTIPEYDSLIDMVMDDWFYSVPQVYEPKIDWFSQAVNDRAEISKVIRIIGSVKVYASGNFPPYFPGEPYNP